MTVIFIELCTGHHGITGELHLKEIVQKRLSGRGNASVKSRGAKGDPGQEGREVHSGKRVEWATAVQCETKLRV